MSMFMPITNPGFLGFMAKSQQAVAPFAAAAMIAMGVPPELAHMMEDTSSKMWAKVENHVEAKQAEKAREKAQQEEMIADTRTDVAPENVRAVDFARMNLPLAA